MTQRPSNPRLPTEAERITHIISHAREAIAILGDASLEDLARDRTRQLALNYLVAVVGEAANKLSNATYYSLPLIPWGKIVGMRNILIHQYYDVETPVVHDTVANSLPALIAAFDTITDNSQGGQPS